MLRRRYKTAGQFEAIVLVLIILFLPSVLAVLILAALTWQLVTGGV